MSQADHFRAIIRYKYLIILFLLIIAGLIFLVASHYVETDSTTGKGWLIKLLLEQLSTTILIGGFIGILYEIFLRSEFLHYNDTQTRTLVEKISNLGMEASERAQHMRDYFSTSKEQQMLGIAHCALEADTYDFSRMIEEAKRLNVIVNDGSNWVRHYYQRFVQRFEDPQKETAIFLMHPNSAALAVHAEKVELDVAGLRRKIAGTVNLLRKANAKGSPLIIMGHPYYTTMSIYMSEKEAIVTPYFLTKERRTPPVICFYDSGPKSFYQKALKDFQVLMSQSSDISGYTQTDGAPIGKTL